MWLVTRREPKRDFWSAHNFLFFDLHADYKGVFNLQKNYQAVNS